MRKKHRYNVYADLVSELGTYGYTVESEDTGYAQVYPVTPGGYFGNATVECYETSRFKSQLKVVKLAIDMLKKGDLQSHDWQGGEA
jgi:hypothetical protein